MNFEQEMQQRVKEIEDVLIYFSPKEEGFQRKIMEAMNYSLMAGGKRLRPLLMKETFTLFGGQETDILTPFMAALEMIHTYSLVHDDLPAMDNDEYRRGRKTTHVIFGEAMGILAGDGLLNYAFETATRAFDVAERCTSVQLLLYQRIAKALQVMSRKAGIHGMIGGQVIDIEQCEGEPSQNRLDHMYRLKTGALIEASMMIGAILAGAGQQQVERIEQIAGDIGLAFQIKDDILDVTGSPELLGKPVHSDEKNEKTTYTSLMDVNSAEVAVLNISNRAMETYDMLPCQNEFLRLLITKLISRVR